MTYWLVNISGLLGAAELLFICTYITRTYFTHAHFFSVVWGASLLISQIALNGLIRPQIFTILVMYAAWWAFLVGSILGTVPSRRSRKHKMRIRKNPAILIIFALLVLQWTGILYEIGMLGLNLDFGSLITQLRDLRLAGAFTRLQLPPFLSTWRWSHIIYIPIAIFLHSNEQISGKLLALLLGLATISTVLHFTRAPLTQLVIVCLVSWILIYQPSRMSKAFVFGLAVLLMIIVFIVTQSALLGSDPAASVTLGVSFLSYIGLSPRAYETILTGSFPRSQGIYSLDAANFVLSKLSLLSSYPSLVRPFIYDPLVTNLYTFLDAFTLDCGPVGALIGAGIIGFISSWFYICARRAPNVFNVIVYSYLVYGCVVAPANNEFIRFGFIFYGVFAWFVDRCVGIPCIRMRAKGLETRQILRICPLGDK